MNFYGMKIIVSNTFIWNIYILFNIWNSEKSYKKFHFAKFEKS